MVISEGVPPELLKGKVAAVFTATWCPMSDDAIQVTTDTASTLWEIVVVDVDRWATLAEQHRIVSIPSVLYLNDGREKKRVVGTTIFNSRTKKSPIKRPRKKNLSIEGTLDL